MNRYALYARKSHEDESRQQRSIADQTQMMTDLAKERGLDVVRSFAEEKSAKEPYQRPLFDEMIALLQDGTVDAVLTYHVNRLARNMVEAGLLQHLLSKRVIREIRTPTEVFRSGDNILPFILQTATSTQYSLDLTSIVRDRLAAKITRGEYPQRAPEGYRNDPFRHRIEKDEKRFPLVEKAWELMATGGYSLEKLAALMNDQWGYTTREAYKVGGKPISKSGLHRLFHNVFYTGYFLYNGELHKGAHEPMISWDTYEAVQKVLGRAGATRARIRRAEFAFAGLILCGTCGRRVTAEHKRGRHGRGDFVYYHCANYRACKEKAIREEVVEAAVTEALNAVRVDPAFAVGGRAFVEDLYARETERDQSQLEQLHRSLEEAERKMRRLVQMKLNDLLTDDEFGAEKGLLQAQLNEYRRSAAVAQGDLERARDGALATLEFVTRAPLAYTVGTPGKKREIARQLGAVFELAGGKIRLELHPLLVPFLSGKTVPIEPLKTGSGEEKETTEKSVVSPGWAEGTTLEPLHTIFQMILTGESSSVGHVDFTGDNVKFAGRG